MKHSSCSNVIIRWVLATQLSFSNWITRSTNPLPVCTHLHSLPIVCLYVCLLCLYVNAVQREFTMFAVLILSISCMLICTFIKWHINLVCKATPDSIPSWLHWNITWQEWKTWGRSSGCVCYRACEMLISWIVQITVNALIVNDSITYILLTVLKCSLCIVLAHWNSSFWYNALENIDIRYHGGKLPWN